MINKNSTTTFKIVKVPKSELKIYSFFSRNGYFRFSLIFLFFSIAFFIAAVWNVQLSEVKNLWVYLSVLVLGFSMVSLCVCDALMNMDILKDGILTVAKVDRIREVEPNDGGVHFFMYRIVFSDHKNNLVVVKKRSNDFRKFKHIKVLYKENNPGKFILLDEIFLKYGNEKSELSDLIDSYSTDCN